MEVINAIVAALLVLLVGDLISTFLYHVPEHIFGKFHVGVHHRKNRNFMHYAVLSKNPLVLIDGFLGVLPYFIFLPWFSTISMAGTVLGILFGEFHVIWRHVSILNWETPEPVKFICNLFCITTPERHWLHHQDAHAAYGDIFTFYDRPAQAWLRFLLFLKRKIRQRTKRTSQTGLAQIKSLNHQTTD